MQTAWYPVKQNAGNQLLIPLLVCCLSSKEPIQKVYLKNLLINNNGKERSFST